MTREEASIIIGNIPINGDGCYSISEYQQAKARAIEALEQQPCDDCISRQAVLDAINTYDKFGYTETGCFVREPKGDYVPYIHYDDVIKCIKNAPSVTPKEKTGRWISFGIQGEIDGQIVRAFTCSKCGAISIFRVSNGNIVNGGLCPNCGAKMQEAEE